MGAIGFLYTKFPLHSSRRHLCVDRCQGGHLCILEEYVRIHSRFTLKLRPPKYPCNKGHAIFRTPCYNWGPYKLIMLKKV